MANKQKEFRDLIWNRDQILEEKIESAIFDGEQLTENFLQQNSNFIFSKNLINTLSESQVLTRGPKLRDLNLSNNPSVKPCYLQRIGFHAPNLERLNLRNLAIDRFVLRHIRRTLVNLKALDISNCLGLNERAISKFFRKGRLRLEHLSLAGLTQAVTSRSLRGLDVLSLVYLDVSLCNRLDPTFFLRFAGADRLPLKYLKLCFLEGAFDSASLAQIFRRAPDLKILDMESAIFAKKAEPESIFQALDCCYSLKKLNFSGVTSPSGSVLLCSDKEWGSVTHLSLKNFRPRDHMSFRLLIGKCTGVKFLDVSNNPQLDADSLKSLLAKLPKCLKVRLELTRQISEKALDHLRTEFAQVTFLRNIFRRTKAKDSGLRVPIPTKQADWPVFGKKKKKR